MPVHNLCFRASCGQFVTVFLHFMTRRASFARKMRVQVITTRNRLDVLLFVFVASYFLCCGDVESNPGPLDKDDLEPQARKEPRDDASGADKQPPVPRTVSTEPTASRTTPDTGIAPDMASQILDAIRQQSVQFQSLETNMNQMRNDLGSIKTDMGLVRTKCEEIDERCNRLETNYQTLSSAVQETNTDVGDLFDASKENSDDISRISLTVGNMEKEIANLKSEADRLEEFSRRDNLRMYGIPHSGDYEDYDACARAVSDVLNSVEGPKRWTPDDIARAHRVGQSRNGEPKPMIVKFSRWKDKIAILRNRKYRDDLEKNGVRVANDLTKNQARVVAEAKKEGKVAYFRKGKLMVGPKRPDPRSYADVAAADDTGDRTHATTPERSADHVNNGGRGQGQPCEPERRDPAHPGGHRTSSQASSTQSARANRGDAPSGSQQRGLHDYWTKSPVNKTPRRSDRKRR